MALRRFGSDSGYICAWCRLRQPAINLLAGQRFGHGSLFVQNHFRSNSTLPTSLVQSKEQDESLEERYASVLNNLVFENLSTVETFLAEQPIDNGTTELDHLQGLVDDTYPVTTAIKRLAKTLNSNYHQVVKHRQEVPRYRPPLTDYNWFLTQLYPKGGRIRISTLYDSYNALPSPKPLHISPQHLEDLLSALMGPRNETEVYRAVFARILDEVEQVGMPISQHELNAALSMAIREYYQDMELTQKMMKQNTQAPSYVVKLSEGLKQQQQPAEEIGQHETLGSEIFQEQIISPSLESLLNLYKKIGMNSHTKDISTVNILYQFALKTKDSELAAQTSQPIRNGNIVPDRITFLIEIIEAGKRKSVDEVKQLYKEMCARHYVIDIVTMNVLLKALTNCNDRMSAETVYNAILAQEPKNSKVNRSMPQKFEKIESIGPGVSPESRQMNQLRMIDFVLHLTAGNNLQSQRSRVQNALQFSPDKYTFGTMFGYYCHEAGDVQSALGMIPTMQEHGELLRELHYIMLYRGFVRHSAENKQWSSGLLVEVTHQLIVQHQEQQKFKSETGVSLPSLLTRKLCNDMFEAFSAVYWTRKSDIRIIWDEYKRGLQPVKISRGVDDEDSAVTSRVNPIPVAELVLRAAKQLINSVDR